MPHPPPYSARDTDQSVFLHFHIGGLVIGDERSQDSALAKIADNSSVLCFSISYRLALENLDPAWSEDCFDAAEWLIENAESAFGVPLCFIGGESAGALLTFLSTIHLLQSKKSSSFTLTSILPHFGSYDRAHLPHVFNFRPTRTLFIDHDTMIHTTRAAYPGRTTTELKHPSVSPLYADLGSLSLPPAPFTVGTMDPLLDDTMFMGLKWMVAGAETVVKVCAGASHAYLNFPEELYPAAKEVFADVKTFIGAKIA